MMMKLLFIAVVAFAVVSFAAEDQIVPESQQFANKIQSTPLKVVKQIHSSGMVDSLMKNVVPAKVVTIHETVPAPAPAPAKMQKVVTQKVVPTTKTVMVPAPPTPVPVEADIPYDAVAPSPPVVYHTVVQKKVIVNEVPAPAPEAKVVKIFKPVPVPVPVPVKAVEADQCGVSVGTCFAKGFKVEAPTFTQPLSEFSGSYRAMCAPEIAAKKAAVEKKLKKELSTKELCAKSEKNTKFAETKMKLMLKKELYSKAVGEGKEKFLEKKVKAAEENAAKVAGQTMEFTKKANEKQNKKEDELYTKECNSKENAFKTVREGKQKMKIVYVKSVPKPTPVPAPVPVVVPVIKHQTQIINKVVPAPAPAQVQKTVVYVPAPSKTVEHTVVVQHDSMKEVLIKNGEKTQKSQLKSEELLGKSEITGKEQVHKESTQKVKATPIVVVHKSDEGACKEKESKESLRKSEIEQKLAVEKVKKEAATKEIAAKKAVPVVVKKCNPVTALEKYVKKCKAHEELFAKAKITNEKVIKEIKIKSAQNDVAVTCEMTQDVCKKIYSVSQLSDKEVQQTVEDHTAKFQAAIAAAEKKNTVDEGKMKYNICESAASDVKYFVRHYLPKFTLLE